MTTATATNDPHAHIRHVFCDLLLPDFFVCAVAHACSTSSATTVHLVARIVDTTALFTKTAITTRRSDRSASILGALTFLARFTAWTGHPRTRVFLTKPVHATLITRTRRTRLFAAAALRIAELACCAGFGVARIVFAYGLSTKLRRRAILFGITSGCNARCVDTDTIARALGIDLTRSPAHTLAFLTSRGSGAFQIFTWIIHATAHLADTACFALIAVGDTLVWNARTASADLVAFASDPRARIGFALPIQTELLFGAEDPRACCDTISRTADLILRTILPDTRVFHTLSIDAQFALSAICGGCARSGDTSAFNADLRTTALFVKLTPLRNALSIDTDLARGGASDAKTRIIHTSVAWGIADATVTANTRVCAIAFLAFSSDTNFTDSARRRCTRIRDASAIDAALALGTRHAATAFYALVVRRTAELIRAAWRAVRRRTKLWFANSFDATLRLGAVARVALGWLTDPLETDIHIRAIDIDLASGDIHTLTKNTALVGGIGALHLEAWIFDTSALDRTGPTKTTRHAVARVRGTLGCAGRGVADLIGLASKARCLARIFTAHSVSTSLIGAALHSRTRLKAGSIGRTADFASSTGLAFAGIRQTSAFFTEIILIEARLCLGRTDRHKAAALRVCAKDTDPIVLAIDIDTTSLTGGRLKGLGVAKRRSSAVTDLDFKRGGFAFFAWGGGPSDLSCLRIDGRPGGGLLEFPCMRVACIGVAHSGRVSEGLTRESIGWRRRRDLGWIVARCGQDTHLPTAFGAETLAVAKLDLKVKGFPDIVGSGGPFNLACVGIDGGSGRKRVAFPCVRLVRIGIDDKRLELISLVGVGPCLRSAAHLGRFAFVSNANFPDTFGASPTTVTNLHLKSEVFSDIVGSGRPVEFSCLGINGRTARPLVQFPSVRISDVWIDDFGFVGVRTALSSVVGRRTVDDRRSVGDTADFDAPAELCARVFVVADFDLEGDGLSSIAWIRRPVKFSCLRIDGCAARPLVQFPSMFVACVGVLDFGFEGIGYTRSRLVAWDALDAWGLISCAHPRIPRLLHACALGIADFDFPRKLFAIVACARRPCDLACFGIDRGSCGFLIQLPCQNIRVRIRGLGFVAVGQASTRTCGRGGGDLWGTIRIDHQDLPALGCAIACAIANSHLKLELFSDIASAWHPCDLTCFGIDGCARRSFAEFPCVCICCVRIPNRRLVRVAFVFFCAGLWCSDNLWQLISCANADFPCLFSAKVGAIAHFDLKFEFFPCIARAGRPFDLASLGIDGGPCRQACALPSVGLVRIGIHHTWLVSIRLCSGGCLFGYALDLWGRGCGAFGRFVDLTVAIVVFAITLRLNRLIIGALSAIRSRITVLPTIRPIAPLFCAATHALLFGTQRSREVFVDLAVAIVVFAIALGLDGLVIGTLGGVFCCATRLPAIHTITSLLGPAAYALLIRTQRRIQVVIDLSIAIVIFSVTNLRLFGSIACASPPFPRSIAGL